MHAGRRVVDEATHDLVAHGRLQAAQLPETAGRLTRGVGQLLRAEHQEPDDQDDE